VSGGLINALIPFEVVLAPPNDAKGTVVDVVVKTLEGTSSPYSIRLLQKSPALFTLNATGAGSPHIYDAVTWKLVESMDTTTTSVLLATGLGPTDPPGSSDAGGSSIPPFNEIDLSKIKVYMGDTAADLLWAGLMPGYPGVYMLNVKANTALSTRVYLQQSGVQSNITDVDISSGSNVANVTGTINALIAPGRSSPLTSPIDSSLAFQGLTFTASFDIRPAAKPFVVAAVAESATAVIRFDPSAGTYDAALMVPTPAARVGDFAGFYPFYVYDFVTLHDGAICDPFPGNRVPLTRLDYGALWGISRVPLMNTSDLANTGTALFRMTGSAPAGSRFTISDAENSILSNFGGFLQTPCASPFPSHTDTLKLFVDGKLVALRDVSYALMHR
jgi:uncharacterized protein (TIGR03437 family)